MCDHARNEPKPRGDVALIDVEGGPSVSLSTDDDWCDALRAELANTQDIDTV